MHISFNQIITLTRGDTAEINLANITEEAQHIISEADMYDVFYLGIMEPGKSFEDAIVKKLIRFNDIKDDKIIFKLSTFDTQYLKPGKYYYSIKQGNTENNELKVRTIIPNTLFWLE